MCLVSLSTFAQDPDVGGSIVVGVGTPPGNPTGAPFAPNEPVSFTIDAGSSSGLLRWPPPGGAEFQVNISVQNMGVPVVEVIGGTNYFAAPEIMDMGNGVYYISILQNAAIPEYEYTTFRISGKATGTTTGTMVGYQANGNPGGYNTTNVGQDNPSSFGPINMALPVTLVSFKAFKENSTALLSWETTSETNSDYFEIQHSIKGNEWTKIGKVASNGESTTLKNYTFSHSCPVNGVNLYRLKMVDKDATFAYSRIQSLSFDGIDKDLSVYPNPTVDVLRIRDFSQVTKVSIFDMNGKAVLESGANTTGEISVRNLTSGMYLVRVSRSNGLTSSQKIVVGK